MQVYTFSTKPLGTKHRVVALLATLVVLGAGAALLLVGLALLATFAVAGGVLGAGVLAYRALRGARSSERHGSIGRYPSAHGLDPSLEVFADQPAIDRPDPPSAPNDERHRLPG